MIDVIHVEIAAAGLFALLFFSDYSKRQLQTVRTALFQILIGVMMVSAILKVDSDLGLRYGKVSQMNEMIKSLSCFFELVCVLALHNYILAVVGRLKKNSVSFFVDVAIFGIMGIFTLTAPWTHWCFCMGEDGTINHRWMFYVIGVVVFGYLIYDLWAIWLGGEKRSAFRKGMCSGMIFGFMATAFVEISNSSKVTILNICIVFFTFIYYFSFQSPDHYVDSATEVYNREAFSKVLRERMSYGKATYCFFVRVRSFNSLTKIYGEEVLRIVQNKIRDALLEKMEDDKLYHIGASTFGVMLSSDREVHRLYEEMKRTLPTLWCIQGENIKHDYSYYKVAYPEDGEDFQELMQRVHYARSDHENHHVPGELIQLRHDTVEESEHRNEVARLIEEAVLDNSIEIHFQPIYSLEKDRITSLEVLARLKDRKKQYINPEEFIHVAEESRMIIPLGEQIFTKACIFASQNHIFDMGIEDININLSPGQCKYEKLTEKYAEIAAQYGISMDRIHLEITESEFKDADAVGRTLQRFKDIGAKVALDDFGTGYSTLSNILELPVDLVKIDKSLVWSYAEGKNQFLNDLMPMIKADGKKIIAEGIETERHIEIIKKLQGDFLQGYYFSMPLNGEEFIRFMEDFQRRHGKP